LYCTLCLFKTVHRSSLRRHVNGAHGIHMSDERVVKNTKKQKSDNVRAPMLAPSAAGGSDPFMGFSDHDDPFESCTLPPVAAARGVTSIATTPVSETVAPNLSSPPAALASRTFLTAQVDDEAECREGDDDDGAGCSSRSATPTVTPYHGIEVGEVTTVTVATSRPTTTEAVVSAVQHISTGSSILPHPPVITMTDDHIVDYFVPNPDHDGQEWATSLLHSGHVAVDDASKLFTRVQHVKHILSTYASTLIIRRSQVRDGATAEAADAFLRNELYNQSGQKL